MKNPTPAVAGLVGKFHAHLTFELTQAQESLCASWCRDNKVKLTRIELSRGDRQQTDVMATVHFRDPQVRAVGRIEKKLRTLVASAAASKLLVSRTKLEHESVPTIEPFSPDNYHEIHIKLSIAADVYARRYQQLLALGNAYGFVPSRNPYERSPTNVTQFVNMRVYRGGYDEATARVNSVRDALARGNFSVLETKRETVVFDTNRNQDTWWA